MTNEEARNRIDCIIIKHEVDDENVTITNEKDYDALRAAYKALEQPSPAEVLAAVREEIDKRRQHKVFLKNGWSECLESVIRLIDKHMEGLKMTNQQAYENLCIKAERFDKVVDALNAIRKEITEMHTFKCIYDEDCIHGDPIDRDDVLGVIDKYYGQLTND